MATAVARAFLPVKHTLLPASPTPPAPAAKDTHALLPASPPRQRLRRRIPMYPLPAPPTPPAPSQKDTHTLLPAPPPCPRLRQEIPGHFCRHPRPARAFVEGYPHASAGTPHPTRAFGAPPPPPPGGGVRAWRYLVGSRIRLFSRVSPCCGPCGYRHGGWG